jgi:hypothetical protein
LHRTTFSSAVVFLFLSSFAQAAPQGHPFLFFDAAELSALKVRASDASINGLGFSSADAFATLKQKADAARASPAKYGISIPNPDGVGSVYWSYTFSSTPPPPHDNNPNYPVWTQMARGVQAAMESLAFVYAVTGDESYLRNVAGTGAVDMVLALTQWPRWTDAQTVAHCCCPANGHVMQTCLDTSQLSQGVAFVYDVAFAVLTEQERSAVRNALLNKGVVPMAADLRNILAQPSAVAPNYWALRTAAIATGAAALMKEAGTQANELAALAHGSLVRFMDNQGSDGGAFEGQLYGAYATDNIVMSADALRRAGAGDLFSHRWLSGIDKFIHPFWSSDIRTLANFGDSSEAAYWQETLFALASRGNAQAQWALAASGQAKPVTFHQFIWSNPSLPPQVPPGSGTAAFPDVGHAALRAGFAGAPVVAFKTTPPSKYVEHNHFDANSFIINVNGAWVASAAGYRDYFYAPANRFTVGSVGHNTVMVDASHSQDGSTLSGGQSSLVGAKMDSLFDGAGYSTLVGRAAATYKPDLLHQFDRRILYAKPDLAVVLDDLAAPQPKSFSFLLHSGAEGTIAASNGSTLSRRAHGRLETFVHSTAPATLQVKTYPNAASYGPYAEWKTSPASEAKLAAALVFGSAVQSQLANPGFETWPRSWTWYPQGGSVGADTSVARSGQKSVRMVFPSGVSGWVRSSPLDVATGATLQAEAYYRASAATGTVKLQFFFIKNGSYVGGPSASVSVGGTLPFTKLSAVGAVSDPEVSQVVVVLSFSGTGTVWFDDAHVSFSATPPEPGRASVVSLGGEGSGLVVSAPFGVELVGRGDAGQLANVKPSQEGFGGVTEVSSDASVFAAGIDAQGQLKRALLVQGSSLSLNGEALLLADALTTMDVAMLEGTLTVTDSAPRAEASYQVRASPARVALNGAEVGFIQEGSHVRFPVELAPAPGAGPAPGVAEGPLSQGCGGCGGQDASVSMALLVGLGAIRFRKRDKS